MAIWRLSTPDDIGGLMRVANAVHPELPERDCVFMERVKLFPEGSLVLVGEGEGEGEGEDEDEDEVCGYAVSHPIRHGHPPDLDSLLGEIAPEANQFYIHDVCVLPELRGRGHAVEGINKLLAISERYPTTCLVSVYGTSSFWARFGFRRLESISQALSEKLRAYGDDTIYLERQNKGWH
jgi:ribosomal protein S18 acetylase RimI-like enzyme